MFHVPCSLLQMEVYVWVCLSLLYIAFWRKVWEDAQDKEWGPNESPGPFSDLSAECRLVIRWSIMCLSKHSGLHSRLPALEAQLLPTKCHLGTCNTGHCEGVWNRPCHSQPTASLIAPIWHAQPGPMFQSSGIHCTKFKRSDGFMFSKPMFFALNIVTCSSAISKGFFQSYLCGNHSFCDGYKSLINVPEEKKKINLFWQWLIPTEGFQLLGNYIKSA